MPGHPDSETDVVEGTTMASLHMDAHENTDKSEQWTGKFHHSKDKDSGVSKRFRTQSCDRVFDATSGRSQHKSFQKVVGYMWEKWRYWRQQTDADTVIPVHVQALLAPCRLCSDPTGECTVM